MNIENNTKTLSNLSEVQSFFYGQCIFITGVTGLVGKVVLEKILRCCPGIKMVYVHVRAKKGLEPKQRLEKLLNLELFKYVAKILPDYHEKVQAVGGDITKSRLGLSFDDFENIRQNVSIIIHSAANIIFTDPLRKAVEHNIIPVINIMEMAKEMPHIRVVVHVSTVYVKREVDGSVLEEVPKLKVTPFQLLDALQWLDEKAVKDVTDWLVGKTLNTYMITKALAEEVISKKRGQIPVAIVRPSYIFPTYKEPFPGWSDTIQGASGLVFAGGKGILRATRSEKNMKLNIIPVDLVANTIITSAWHTGLKKPTSLFIINCALEFEKLPTLDTDFYNRALEIRGQFPLANIYRYPDWTLYYNDVPYYIHALIDQYIPAIMIDFLLFIFIRKTVLVKVYYKLHVVYDIFYRMCKDPWIGRLDNYKMLRNKLCMQDSKIFFMDTDIDWEECIDNSLYGYRKYIAREDPSNIPYARKKNKIWWTVTTTLKWMIILYFFYYMFNRIFSP